MSGIYHRDDIPADLRGYFVRAEIGLEPTPEAYVAEMVAVFREVRRVLRNDGTLWLNLGDSYATDPKGVGGGANTSGLAGGGKYQAEATKGGTPRPKYRQFGLKKKDLIGIPWRVAFALQADGWYLRQDIIWHKPNPMPESTKDRCTKAHEYLFLLSKSAKYYFDSAAMQEPAVGNPSGNTLRKSRPTQQALQRGDQCGSVPRESNGFRNRRSVWTVTTKPFAGAHFATFPPDLIEPCVLAGAPEGGVVLDPFGGSGTTGGVALKHGRRAILCELNPDYVDLMGDRVAGIAGLPHEAATPADAATLLLLLAA